MWYDCVRMHLSIIFGVFFFVWYIVWMIARSFDLIVYMKTEDIMSGEHLPLGHYQEPLAEERFCVWTTIWLVFGQQIWLVF